MPTDPKPGEVWFAEPKHSAVNVLDLVNFDHRKLSRRMRELSATQMASVKTALRNLLGL